MKIYIAGPFSHPEEREALKHMIELIRHSYSSAELYIPMEYKVEGDFLKEDGNWNLPNHVWAKAVYENDLKELKEADLVVAMYGRHYCSSGTVWEIGFVAGLNAYDRVKPLILYIPPYCEKGSDLSLMVTMGADGILQENGTIDYHSDKIKYLKNYNLK